jgi:O-antigen/teichoic acid export membrane protein
MAVSPTAHRTSHLRAGAPQPDRRITHQPLDLVSNGAVNQGASLPDAQGDRLFRNTFTLLISNGSGAVLGVAFWAFAARLYSPDFVGDGAAEVNAMTLLASFALLNLGTVFPRFLYAAGSRAGVILRAGYAASTSIALVASIVFLLVTSGHRDYMQPGPLAEIVFVAAVVLWVIFTIEDAALVGLRAPFWVPVENTTFSVVKIALLPVFLVVAPRVGVFTSWVLPVVACVCAINLYLFRRVVPAHVRRSSGAGVLPERKVVGKILLGEYFGGLSLTAMTTLPALFIVATLGKAQAAYFQTPWLAGMSFDFLLYSFATSLIVEATARPSMAAATVRKSIRLAAWVLGPSVIVILVCAPWFLQILGSDYAAHGTRLLQYLALAMPFMAVNVLYVTFARLARRVRRVLFVQVSIAAIVLTLCYVLISRIGISGAGVALLAGQGVVGLILLPSVVRQLRHPDMSPSFAPGAALVNRSRSAPNGGDTVDEDRTTSRDPEGGAER